MNFDEIRKLLAEDHEKKVGSLFGFPGVSALDYFAAHAPAVPAWWSPAELFNGEETIRREVEWRWAFAKAMVEAKPNEVSSERDAVPEQKL